MGTLSTEVKTMNESRKDFPNVSLGGKIPMDKGRGDSGPVRRKDKNNENANKNNHKTSS